MEITTKNIIAYLPLDPDFKKDLELNLDKMDPDRKFEIVNNLWIAYDQLFELRFQENLQNAIQKISKGEEQEAEIGPDFYKSVRQKTRKEIEREMSNKTTDYNITAVREKLQKFLSPDKISVAKKLNN